MWLTLFGDGGAYYKHITQLRSCVSERSMEFPAILAGSLFTIAALTAEHYYLWPKRQRIKRPVAYIIGTLTIGAGLCITSLILDHWIIAIAYFGVLLPGGAVIAALWWGRDELPTPADRIIARVEKNRAVSGTPGDRNN